LIIFILIEIHSLMLWHCKVILNSCYILWIFLFSFLWLLNNKKIISFLFIPYFGRSIIQIDVSFINTREMLSNVWMILIMQNMVGWIEEKIKKRWMCVLLGQMEWSKLTDRKKQLSFVFYDDSVLKPNLSENCISFILLFNMRRGGHSWHDKRKKISTNLCLVLSSKGVWKRLARIDLISDGCAIKNLKS